MPKGEGKLIAQNKKARHDYSIIDTMEAGMVLQGTEIKSIRNSRINLKDGFIRVRNGEGITIVPLKVYIRNGYAKVLIGLAKGKKSYDKREDLKRKDIDRQIDRTLKNFSR